jgi:Tol biopolymer transport system component
MFVPRAILLLLCAPATAGCAGPDAPSPGAPAWRATMTFVTPKAIAPATPAPVPAALSGETAAATPTPKPSPSASPTAPTRICFQSDRRPGQGGWDLYLYDRDQDTVLALPGVNTPDDEINPDASYENTILFQRGRAGDPDAQQDLYLYSQKTHIVRPLTRVNSPAFDERDAAISGDGNWIVYVSDEEGTPGIRLYSVQSGDVFSVPGATRQGLAAGSPTLSANGKHIAYEAGPADGSGTTDLFVYDLDTGIQSSPPFANTLANELTPQLSDDGRYLLFASDRFGRSALFEADLTSGDTITLIPMDADVDDEIPVYFGDGTHQILYQARDRTGRIELRLYDRRTALLDTLSVANDPIASSALGL